MRTTTPKTEKNYCVEIVEKEDEERVIFLIGGPQPRDGEMRRVLTAAEEEIAALTEKQAYEQSTGRTLFQFHKDPLAGGLRPIKEPKGQQWKAGPVRAEKFAVTPTGQLVPQGKVGEILEENRVSNIERNTNIMVATAAWTGQWL